MKKSLKEKIKKFLFMLFECYLAIVMARIYQYYFNMSNDSTILLALIISSLLILNTKIENITKNLNKKH